ncbi:hypothetical protein [Moorena sp. SIO3I6]|uniref:hypothetical protein n=1 Tax=Moorena sp. SIO3I6 TaxID=2607831 RepID=UPI0025FD0086|nr:hypothetical protein [Moorena sp. SIO3I6]
MGETPMSGCIKTINRELIWDCIFPELIGLKALYSKLFMAHVTPSAMSYQIRLTENPFLLRKD